MNGQHLDDALAELALGTLPVDDQARAEAHVAYCARCRDELSATREALAGLTLALTPVTPSPAVRSGLLAALAATPQERPQERPQEQRAGHFARFTAGVARLLDVTAGRAREYLDLLVRPASWEPGFAANIRLVHIDGGPAVAGLITGFISVTRGTTFPHHAHFGEEWGYILQGEMHDDDGSVYRPGDEARKAGGTAHSFRAGDDEDLIYLVVLRDGVDIGGLILRPGDPRA